MSYIKIQKIKKENVEVPEKGYIYLGFDDETVGGLSSGIWIKNDDGKEAYYVLSGYATNPSISSILPGTSSYIGDTINIYGNNFVPNGTTVSIGGVPGTSVNVVSISQLSVIIPPVQGNVNVVVSTIYGSSEPYPYTVIYKDIRPIITPPISPTSASIGDVISISGFYFVQDGTITWFNGISGVTNTVSSTFLTAIVPNMPTGTTTLFLRTQYGSSNYVEYLIEDKNPKFYNFYPSYGYIGDTISISGANFAEGQIQVRFGDTQATNIIYYSSTYITAEIATGTPFGDTSIRVHTTSLSGFTVSGVTTGLLPNIISILPLSSSIGDYVTLSGTNLSGTLSISFSNEPVEIVSQNSSTCILYLSSNISPGINSVTVTNKYGTSNIFTYSIASPVLGPIITSFSSTSAYLNSTVNLNGSNFIIGSGNKAYFGGIEVKTSKEATFSLVKTQLTPILPDEYIPTGPIDVKIENVNGSFTKNGFTFLTVGTLPIINEVSPVFAKNGDIVNIYGENLTNCTISFGLSYPGTIATTTIIDDSHVSCVVPNIVNSGENEIVNIYAIGTGGTCKFTPFEIYSESIDSPNLLSFTPTSGTVGTLVTLSGYSFVKYFTDAYINIGGSYLVLDNQTYISNTEIRGYIPNTEFRGATSILVKTPSGSDPLSTFTIIDGTGTTTTTTIAPTTTTTTTVISPTTTTTTAIPLTTTTTTTIYDCNIPNGVII